MPVSSSDPGDLPPQTAAFYRRVLRTLNEAEVPFVVGGAYSFACYTGIVRHTKDLDVFVRPADLDGMLDVLNEEGCHTAITFPHWLAKVHLGEFSVDIIFRSGNGVSKVDDDWHRYARSYEVLGVPVQLCPPEEIIWTKAFVMERERYDGADIAHLILCCGEHMDWDRLITRFDANWRVLLSHLILFGFAYPSDRHVIPAEVMEELLRRLAKEEEAPGEEPPSDTRICRGTLLSRAQFLPDIEEWGYRDARLPPHGRMTPEEIAYWTEAIDDEEFTE